MLDLRNKRLKHNNKSFIFQKLRFILKNINIIVIKIKIKDIHK